MVSGLIFPIGKGGVWCYLVGDLDFMADCPGRDANLGSGVFGKTGGNHFRWFLCSSLSLFFAAIRHRFWMFGLINLFTPLQVFSPKKAYPSEAEKRGDDV